jgi:BirA family transcriptional regulator, biotin operon repressor / biotin---[acetyl-CoA-carboxylase] ligase
MLSYPSYDLVKLRESVRPFKLIWSPRMRSTNDRAITLRKRNQLFAPTVVVTGHQTTGRGRGGVPWFSNQGSLTATFALPIHEALPPHHLPLVAGLAVRDAAAELSGVAGIELKWPNDLYYQGKKLAGLLCERVENVDLIGVGLNLNVRPTDAPLALRSKISSLAKIAGRNIEPNLALTTVAQHLSRTLARRQEQPFAAILADYNQHHILVRHRVVVTNADAETIKGVCEGIDEDGRLLVKQGKILHRVVSGHVELRG